MAKNEEYIDIDDNVIDDDFSSADFVQQNAPLDISKTRSFMQGLSDAATFGTSDEISGAMSSPSGAIKQAANLTGLTDFSDNDIAEYKAQRDFARQSMRDARATNPNTFTTAGLIGGVASALVPGLGAIKGGTTLVKGAKLAAQGAAAGAAVGVGTSEAERILPEATSEVNDKSLVQDLQDFLGSDKSIAGTALLNAGIGGVAGPLLAGMSSGALSANTGKSAMGKIVQELGRTSQAAATGAVAGGALGAGFNPDDPMSGFTDGMLLGAGAGVTARAAKAGGRAFGRTEFGSNISDAYKYSKQRGESLKLPEVQKVVAEEYNRDVIKPMTKIINGVLNEYDTVLENTKSNLTSKAQSVVFKQKSDNAAIMLDKQNAEEQFDKITEALVKQKNNEIELSRANTQKDIDTANVKIKNQSEIIVQSMDENKSQIGASINALLDNNVAHVKINPEQSNDNIVYAVMLIAENINPTVDNNYINRVIDKLKPFNKDLNLQEHRAYKQFLFEQSNDPNIHPSIRTALIKAYSDANDSLYKGLGALGYGADAERLKILNKRMTAAYELEMLIPRGEKINSIEGARILPKATDDLVRSLTATNPTSVRNTQSIRELLSIIQPDQGPSLFQETAELARVADTLDADLANIKNVTGKDIPEEEILAQLGPELQAKRIAQMREVSAVPSEGEITELALNDESVRKLQPNRNEAMNVVGLFEKQETAGTKENLTSDSLIRELINSDSSFDKTTLNQRRNMLNETMRKLTDTDFDFIADADKRAGPLRTAIRLQDNPLDARVSAGANPQSQIKSNIFGRIPKLIERGFADLGAAAGRATNNPAIAIDKANRMGLRKLAAALAPLTSQSPVERAATMFTIQQTPSLRNEYLMLESSPDEAPEQTLSVDDNVMEE